MNLKWSYSSSKGFYIGFKATVVLDYDSMNPISILIHSGAPNDSKLFDEILEILQKRRIIQKGDILIFDKEYYSYQNYQLGISKYKIVPFIFPKRKNRRLFQITQTRIEFKTNTQIHTKISSKNSIFKCIF